MSDCILDYIYHFYSSTFADLGCFLCYDNVVCIFEIITQCSIYFDSSSFIFKNFILIHKWTIPYMAHVYVLIIRIYTQKLGSKIRILLMLFDIVITIEFWLLCSINWCWFVLICLCSVLQMHDFMCINEVHVHRQFVTDCSFSDNDDFLLTGNFSFIVYTLFVISID